MKYFSRTWFTVIFCLAYIPVFALDWPLLLYYPLVKRVEFTELAGNAGPAMHWYGFVASAALAGLIAGLFLKDRWIPNLLLEWLWLAPVAATAASLYLLKGFFL